MESVKKNDPNRLKIKVDGLISQLEKAQTHEEKKVIRNKLEQMGAPVAPYLVSHLQSPNEFTRWEIVSFLGEFKDVSTMIPLIKFAINENEVHARWRSFWAVSRFSSEGAGPILHRYLKSKVFKKRWRAALILSMLGDTKAGKVISEGLQSKDSWIKWEALSAVKSLKYRKEIPTICEIALNEKDENLRREAVLALGYMDSPLATKTLIKSLDDTSPQVRWRASMALTRYNNPSHIWQLRKVLEIEKESIVIEQLKNDIKTLSRRS